MLSEPVCVFYLIQLKPNELLTTRAAPALSPAVAAVISRGDPAVALTRVYVPHSRPPLNPYYDVWMNAHSSRLVLCRPIAAARLRPSRCVPRPPPQIAATFKTNKLHSTVPPPRDAPSSSQAAKSIGLSARHQDQHQHAARAKRPTAPSRQQLARERAHARCPPRSAVCVAAVIAAAFVLSCLYWVAHLSVPHQH